MNTLTYQELLDQKSALLKEIKELELSLEEARGSVCKFPHVHEWLKDMLDYQPSGIYRLRLLREGEYNENDWPDKSIPYVIEMANDRFCEIANVDRETLKARPGILFEQLYPDDKDSFVSSRKSSVVNHTVFSWEGRLLVDDEIIWIHVEALPTKDANDNGDIFFTGIVYDITERMQHDERLKGLIDQLHSTLEEISTLKDSMPPCSK